MAARVKDTALCAVAGIAAATVIWTVSDAAYDAPSAKYQGKADYCPNGIRVSAGPVNTAMGLRAMDVTLENCGTATYRVKGYPGLRPLDEDHERVTGVSVVHGSAGISQVPEMDEPPEPVALEPGETATAGLLWRNTVTEATGPTNLPYLLVEVKPGALRLLVAPDGGLDLGTTGRLGVGPWRATSPDSR